MQFQFFGKLQIPIKIFEADQQVTVYSFREI